MIRFALRLLSLGMFGSLLSLSFAPPQQGSEPYERVPNYQGMNGDGIFPRWLSFTKVDATPGSMPDNFPANENPLFLYPNTGGPMNDPSVAVDSRGVAHVVMRTLNPAGIAYYNTRYDTRQTNGFSARAMLFTNTPSQYAAGNPDVWVDSMDVVHVAFSLATVMVQGPPALGKTDIVYRALQSNGWFPSLGSGPLFLTDARFEYNPPPGTTYADAYSFSQIISDAGNNTHVFGSLSTSYTSGPSNGWRHILVGSPTIDEFNDLRPERIALGPVNNQIYITGHRITAVPGGFGASQGLGYATWSSGNLGGITGFGTAMDDAPDIAVDSAGMPHIAFQRTLVGVPIGTPNMQVIYYSMVGTTVIVDTFYPYKRIAVDSRDQVHLVYMAEVPVYPENPTSPMFAHMSYAARVRNPNPNQVNMEWSKQEPMAATVAELSRGRPPGPAPFPGDFTHAPPSELAISKNDVVHVVDQWGHYTRMIEYGVGIRDPLPLISALPHGTVNVASGNLFFGLRLYSTNGINPCQTTSAVYNSLESYGGLLGPRWRLNYEIYLVDHWQAINNPNGSYTDQTQESVTLFLGSGRPVHFRYRSFAEGSANFCYLVANDEFGFFPKLQRLSWMALNPEYELTFASGDVWTFNNQGKLREIRERTGNCITLNYASGLLVGIVDQKVSAGGGGRSASINYESSSARHSPRAVQLSDPGGKTYTLTYSGEHLAAIQFASGPSTPTWSFDYFETNNPGQLSKDNLLSEVSPPRGTAEGYHYTCRYLQDGRLAEVQDPQAYVLPGSAADGGSPQLMSPKLELRYVTPPMPQNTCDTWVTSKCKSNSGDDILRRYVCDPRRSLVKEFHDPYSSQVGYLVRNYDSYGQLTEQTDRYGCVTQFSYFMPNPLTPHVRDNIDSVTQSRGTGMGMDTVASYTYWINEDFTVPQACITTARSAVESTPTTRASSFLYDLDGRLTSVGHPSVASPDDSPQYSSTGYQFQGPRGSLSQITDENGYSSRFSSYHALHGLPQSIERDGGQQVESMAYDAMGNLVSHTAPAGGPFNDTPNASVYNLDGLYRVSSSVDADGRTTDFGFDLDSNQTSVQLPAGGSTSVTYDKRGFVTGGTTPDGTWSQWVDEEGKVQRFTDARGHTTNYDYDNVSRLIAKRSPGGSTGGGGGGPATHTAEYVYDIPSGSNRVMNIIQVGSSNRVTSITYDRRGRSISTLYPDGQTRRDSTYNEIDELVATQTYDGETLLQTHVNLVDHRGRHIGARIQSTGFQFGQAPPQGSRTSWSFLDATGAVVQAVGHRGEVSSPNSYLDKVFYLRDERGRITEVQKAFNGQLATVEENVYGDDDRLIERRIPDPVYPTGSLVTHLKLAYTSRKEIKSSLNANNQGTTYTYGLLQGQVDTETDAGGTVKKTTYHTDTQRVAEVIDGYGSPSPSRVRSTWTNGLLTTTEVFNPASGAFNASFTRTYDAAGRLERLQAPEVEPEIYTYSAYGELSNHAAGMATATHTYNSMGQRTDTVWTGAFDDEIEHGYDADGRLTLLDDGTYRKEWTYNAETGYLGSERFYLMGSLWKSHDYEYDESGNLIQLTDGESGIHEWVYDDANRVVSIRYAGMEVCTMDYSREGALVTTTLRNSSGNPIAETAYSYDSKGRRVRAHTYRTEDGVTLADLRWEYDARDRITKIQYYHLGVETALEYNFKGEVISETTAGNGSGANPPALQNELNGPPTGNPSEPTSQAQSTPAGTMAVANRSATCTYDPGGNRLTQTVGGVTTTFTYDSASRLSTQSRSGFDVQHEYDDWGNEVERTTTQGGNSTIEAYGYNYHNRLSTYVRTVNSIMSAQWQYDYWPSGERAGKTNLASQAGEVYLSHRDNVVTDYVRSGATITSANSYGQGLGLDQKSVRIPASGGRIHYIGDRVGTVSVTLTDSGMKSEECVRDSWGLTLAGDTDNERYGFAQRERDSESGLVYMRFRYYDPALGRFLQVDPLPSNRWSEAYSYCKNNPVSNTDPLGQFLLPVHEEINKTSLGGKISKEGLDSVIAAGVALDVGATIYTYVPFLGLIFGSYRWGEHFDNNAFDEGVELINKRFEDIKNVRTEEHAWTLFGYNVHAIQDFYSHSNFVELWLAVDKTDPAERKARVELLDDILKRAKAKPEEIPTWSMTKKRGRWTIAGGYELESGSCGMIGSVGYQPTHGQLNKDSAESGEGKTTISDGKTTLFDFARAAALKHTEKFLLKFKEAVKVNPNLKPDKMFTGK